MPRINLKHVAAIGSAAVMLAMGLVVPHEGKRNETYLDPVGIPTICRGHTGPEVRLGQTATDEQCDRLLAKDLKIANDAVNRLVRVPMTTEVEAAMTDFTYNVGQGAFGKSTMLRLLNAGKTRAACEQFPRWHYADGRDCRVRSNNCYGLIKRRADQQAMCMAGAQ